MKNKKIIIILIIILFFICNLFIGYTFAKYNSKIVGNVNMQIANPIIEVESDEEKQIDILSPKALYNFNIKNYNDNEKINEVEMNYCIEIVSKNLKDLELHLYKGEEEISLVNYKTQEISLSNTEKQLDKYRLDASFIGNLKENLQSEVQIKVHSIQKE